MRGDRSVEWPGGGLPVVRWRQACTLARPAASLPRACRVGPTDMHARCGGQCMPCMGINRRDRDGMGVRQRIRGACTESTVRRRRASPRTTTKGMRRSVGRPGSSIYHDARDVPAVSTVWCFTRTQTPVAPCIICAPCAMMCVRARRTVPVRPLKP
jgi:hypothetical protein